MKRFETYQISPLHLLSALLATSRARARAPHAPRGACVTTRQLAPQPAAYRCRAVSPRAGAPRRLRPLPALLVAPARLSPAGCRVSSCRHGCRAESRLRRVDCRGAVEALSRRALSRRCRGLACRASEPVELLSSSCRAPESCGPVQLLSSSHVELLSGVSLELEPLHRRDFELLSRETSCNLPSYLD